MKRTARWRGFHRSKWIQKSKVTKIVIYISFVFSKTLSTAEDSAKQKEQDVINKTQIVEVTDEVLNKPILKVNFCLFSILFDRLILES